MPRIIYNIAYTQLLVLLLSILGCVRDKCKQRPPLVNRNIKLDSTTNNKHKENTNHEIQIIDTILNYSYDIKHTYDFQGNKYRTVIIGNQEWFGENLNTKVLGSWCTFDKEENCQTYGRLYCWYVAKDVCPTGWILPSDSDWMILEKYLGVPEIELNEEGLRGTTQGGILKDTILWSYPNQEATNSLGFSALPGGPRYKLGMYGLLGHNATFWTSSETDSSHAIFRYLGNSHSKIGRTDNEKIEGHSIRCMRYVP